MGSMGSKSEEKIVERRPGMFVVPSILDFNARENFIVGTSKKAKVKIKRLGSNFRKYFLPIVNDENGKEVKLVPNTVLEYSRDIEFIAALGGEDKTVITLGQLFSVLASQPNGEPGFLLTNGDDNISFVDDVEYTLWRVKCSWDSVGWYIEAWQLGGSPGVDDQVISRL
jgi:hypothetical protein